MTIEVKHLFQSAKGDGADTSLVKPSDWNAIHTFEVTGPALLGRVDTGAGAVEEIPLGEGLVFEDGILKATASSWPVGIVLPLAGNYEPPGWLICDGRAVSRTTYNVLFTITQDKFGVGDGVTTFNIPDMRGRVPAGKDNLGGTAANRLTTATFPTAAIDVGKVSGTETHILTSAQVEKHPHTLSSNTHKHFIASGFNTGASPFLSSTRTLVSQNTGQGDNSFALHGEDSDVHPATQGETSDYTHTHTIPYDAEDDINAAHMNLQPTITMNYVIWTGVYPP